MGFETILNEARHPRCTPGGGTDTISQTCTVGTVIEASLATCRAAHPIDAGTDCQTGHLITNQEVNNGCDVAPATVQSIDSACLTDTLIIDQDATVGNNACAASACTNGQGVDTSTHTCKDIQITLECTACTPNTGSCSPSPPPFTSAAISLNGIENAKSKLNKTY